MDRIVPQRRRVGGIAKLLLGLLLLAATIAGAVMKYWRGLATHRAGVSAQLAYRERASLDTGGFMAILPMLERWPSTASLEQVADVFRHAGDRDIERLDQTLARSDTSEERRITLTLMKASLINYEGEPARAYRILEEARTLAGVAGSSGRTVALHRHLLPGSDRPAVAARTITASIAGARAPASSPSSRPPCIPIPPAPDWPSGISPSISSGSPTTSGSAGS